MSTWSISEEFAREHARALHDLASGLLLGAMEARSGISALSADSLEEASHEAEGLALAFERAVQPGDRDGVDKARACIAELLAALDAALPLVIEAESALWGSDRRVTPQIHAAIAKTCGDAS